MSMAISAPASWAILAISSTGCQAPVEVSAWTIPTTLGPTRWIAALTSSGSKTSPYGRSIAVTSAPARSATSSIRPPKTPLTQTSILSPGSIRLTTTASIPAEPVPETASVSRFLVWKT